MSIIAKAATGPSITALLLTTASRQRPGWTKQVESGTAHPGFLKLTSNYLPDPMLSHPNGWSDNDNYTLEENPSNPARLVVEPGESTIVWYGDSENGLTAQQIADLETAAGRPRTASQVTANWIRDQTTTDYGKHPDRPVVHGLLNSAVRLRAEGLSMWALYKAGTTLASSYALNPKQGESMLHPILFGTFGGDAPVNVAGEDISFTHTAYKQANVVFQGLDIPGISWINENADNWILNDTDPHHEPTSNPTGNRLTFHGGKQSRCVKTVPANGTKWASGSADRSSGVYLGPGYNQYFKYNWSYHNAWADNYDPSGLYLNEAGVPTYGQPPSDYSHNYYMSGASIGQAWVECLSVMPAFSHAQKRSGGEEIVCGYIGGNAYGIEANGYVLCTLETVEQMNSFGGGHLVSFSDSDVSQHLESNPTFARRPDYQAINFASNLPAGFDPVGRTVTSPEGGYGVVTAYRAKGTYSAKTAVVIEDMGYKHRIPSGDIGVRNKGFNGLMSPDWVHDWVLLCNAADPNNPDDVALKADAEWDVAYGETYRFYSDLTVFNFGAGNDRNADHISEENRNAATLGRFVDQLRGMPARTHTRFEAAEYLDSLRNPGLLSLDYIDYMANLIGKPSPKRTTPGTCVWTAYELLSGHNADQPRNWTADGVNFTWPIDGDDLVLDGGKPHWLRTCRAVDISLGLSGADFAEPVIYGGLMSSSGVVSGNGKVTLKNGGQFWYRGTNTGQQRFDGNGGRLGIAGTAPITGLDVRVGDAGADGFTEIVVLAGSSATFTDLHLTGRAVLKLDGIDGGTASATIGNLTMTKMLGHLGQYVTPRIGKIRSGHFGINPTAGQPYNATLTGNVNITGTITAVGYNPGDVVLDPTNNRMLLDSLVTTGATFVGCALSGGKILAT